MKKNKIYPKYLVSTSPNLEGIVSYDIVSRSMLDYRKHIKDLTDVILSFPKEHPISTLALDNTIRYVKIGNKIIWEWTSMKKYNKALYLIKIKT